MTLLSQEGLGHKITAKCDPWTLLEMVNEAPVPREGLLVYHADRGWNEQLPPVCGVLLGKRALRQDRCPSGHDPRAGFPHIHLFGSHDSLVSVALLSSSFPFHSRGN